MSRYVFDWNPKKIGETDWYYEGGRYFIFVHEVRDSEGVFIKTDQIKVPFLMLKKSVDSVRSVLEGGKEKA